MEPRYRVHGSDGKTTDYRRDQIFHLRTMGRLPYFGDSPVNQAREAGFDRAAFNRELGSTLASWFDDALTP